MIKLTRERLIPLARVPRLLPRRNGKKLNLGTVYRWAKGGVRGVRLETLKIGGTTYTSASALQRFAEQLTAGERRVPATSAPHRPAARSADEVLDRAGI